MAGTVVADTLQAASTSTLVIKNGVANTPPTIQDSAGTQIGTFCRAWVNFNGTTVTNPASMTGVRASFNVSSILDNAAGNYTINFTNAMPDTDYVMLTSGNQSSSSDPVTTAAPVVTASNTTQNTNNCTVKNLYAGTAFDSTKVCVAIFR